MVIMVIETNESSIRRQYNRIGTRRLRSLLYLLCYAALLKILPSMLKLMLNIYLLCSNYA